MCNHLSLGAKRITRRCFTEKTFLKISRKCLQKSMELRGNRLKILKNTVSQWDTFYYNAAGEGSAVLAVAGERCRPADPKLARRGEAEDTRRHPRDLKKRAWRTKGGRRKGRRDPRTTIGGTSDTHPPSGNQLSGFPVPRERL